MYKRQVPYGEIVEMEDSSPTLTFNSIGRHQSMMVTTRIASNKSPWLYNTHVGDYHTVPISHGEGRFIASPAVSYTHLDVYKRQPHHRKETFEEMSVRGLRGRTRAFMKIEDGCERYCSYCIIPTARGPIRSKPLELSLIHI